jgi:hypothetical protein
MSNEKPKEAWVRLASEAQIRAAAQGKTHPYDHFLGGKVARMSRLLMAHPVIGPVFRQLSTTLLFGPGFLTRPEREMVAAVAASAQDCLY